MTKPSYKDNKSGQRGVYYSSSRNKWCVQLSIDGKSKFFGHYVDLTEAVEVCKNLRLKYYGEFA